MFEVAGICRSISSTQIVGRENDPDTRGFPAGILRQACPSLQRSDMRDPGDIEGGFRPRVANETQGGSVRGDRRDGPRRGTRSRNIAERPAAGGGKAAGRAARDHVAEALTGAESNWHGLRGLLIAQIFGQFNDQAWKQLVILLAMAAVVGEAEKQERIAIVTMMLLIPLTIISLPAGVLADRVSKRSVLIAMKVLELILMLAGAAALFVQPDGGLAVDRRSGLGRSPDCVLRAGEVWDLARDLASRAALRRQRPARDDVEPVHAGRHRGRRDHSLSGPRPPVAGRS